MSFRSPPTSQQEKTRKPQMGDRSRPVCGFSLTEFRKFVTLPNRPCRWIQTSKYLNENKRYKNTCPFQRVCLYLQQKGSIMINTIPSESSQQRTVEALWTLIQGQTKAVRKALVDRILSEQEQSKKQKESQQAMVRESLTRAFDELRAGKVNHNARELFKD